MRIVLSGDVGWEITPQGVREQLDKAAGADVELVISSRGGLVGAALEIYNMLRSYPGQTTAILSGYAMSAASYIPMACKRVLAEDNAVFMVHNAWGVAVGDHREMRKVGGILGGLSNLLAGAYARFTGKSREQINQLLADETWLFGEEIVAAGFAHETIAPQEAGEDDAASALAAARIHFDQVRARLSYASTTVLSDLSRVANMAGGGIGNSGDGHFGQPHQSTKEPVMDLKTLKEKHPDLVAAIIDEAKAAMHPQHETALTEARAKGAEDERARIADVRAQLIPGHENLIETMAADGKSTGADAAKAIVAAEKVMRANAQAAASAEANQPVPPVVDGQAQGKTIKRQEYDTMDTATQRQFIAGGGKVVD